MFYRSYDGVSFQDAGFPAHVDDFVLDRYEVTVGRFRAFVNAGFGTQANPPSPGAGAHPGLAGSGWDSAWSSLLAMNTAALVKAVKCGQPYETWTDAQDENESKPITCATWSEAMAFCIWDGGYLATEAEWNYAASGGDEQRVYPWSSPASSSVIDCTYANYYVNSPAGTFCVTSVTGATNRVGSESPKGDGRWGHADLVGNAWEWTLDWYASTYSLPCDGCANLTPATFRVIRGGSSIDDASYLHAAKRGNLTPTDRGNTVGFRCARNP
jgi:formylglycine-generating enzyme required for sulfatase activity